jgi:hypothetical protein
VKTIVLSHTGWLDAEGELLPGRRGFWRWRPAAIAVAVVSVCLWAPDFVDHHDVILPGIYLVLVAVAATFISVSAARVPGPQSRAAQDTEQSAAGQIAPPSTAHTDRWSTRLLVSLDTNKNRVN